MFGGFVEFSRSCSPGTTKPTTEEAFPSLKLLSKNKVLAEREKEANCGMNGTMGSDWSDFVPALQESEGPKNLLGFPVAARLASGLYTGLCSCHPGRVHCLGVWKKRKNINITPETSSRG